MRHREIPQLIKEGSKLDSFLTRQFSTSMFTYREIFGMLGPLILDQFFMFFMGVLTTAMISSSGEDSISAVSLVGPISSLIMSFFSAISAGGTVVVAQYKGRGDEEKMRRAGGQVVLATFLTALVSAAALIIFAGPLIHLLFGAAEETVQIKAQQYLIGLSISFITFSLYQGAFSVMRGVGDTKTCLRLTVIINFLYFLAALYS